MLPLLDERTKGRGRDPRQEGAEARARSLPRSACPYDAPIERREWLRGWAEDMA